VAGEGGRKETKQESHEAHVPNSLDILFQLE